MLYHFSEDPNIKVFHPRPAASFPQYNPVVFAIDRAHAVHYMFPRDCPRVIYWKAEWTTDEDASRMFADPHVSKVIAVENRWLDRIRSTPLYCYTLPEETFVPFGDALTAGYYISYETVTPVHVERIDDMLGRIVAEKAELRFMPNLYPLRDTVRSSTADYSIIRFRNAVDDAAVT